MEAKDESRGVSQPVALRDRSTIATAAAVSAVLHAILLLVLISQGRDQSDSPTVNSREEKLVTVQLVPLKPQVLPESPVPEPEPDPVRFTRTDESQVGPADEETRLRGEFETQAMSERAPDADAPNRPSQDGEKPLNPEQVETTQSRYVEGEIKPPTETAPPVAASEESPPIEEAREAQDTAAPQPQIAETESEVDTEADVVEPIQETERAEKVAQSEPPKQREETIEEEKKEEKIALPPRRKTVPVSQDPAFKSHVEKNRITGAIGRVGAASAQNVKATPLGKYEAEVSRIIEQAWRIQSNRFRDLIVPGVLSVQFFVDKAGRISGVAFVQVMAGGEVQKGFTLRAITGSKLPKMPDQVVDELGGRPLEAVYNFHF